MDSTGFICVVCNTVIKRSSTGGKKYCSEYCRIKGYHQGLGIDINIKKCQCGCGGYMISEKPIPEERIFKRGHKKRGIVDPNLKRCHICNERTSEIFKLDNENFKFEVCKRCLDNIKGNTTTDARN